MSWTDWLSRMFAGTFGTTARPAAMAMDAWREGDEFVVEFDLPGVKPESVDLDLERNVLTVRAERPLPEPTPDLLSAERPHGVFSRQLILGDNLDTEQLTASYEAGVLTLRIPVAEKAKPRKIEVQVAGEDRRAIRS